MAQQSAARQPSNYELLGQRIQKIINSPAAQRNRSALLHKAPDESPEDWAQLLADIAEADNVSLAEQADGSVRLSWTLVID